MRSPYSNRSYFRSRRSPDHARHLTARSQLFLQTPNERITDETSPSALRIGIFDGQRTVLGLEAGTIEKLRTI